MEEWLSQFDIPANTNVPSFARGLEILLVDEDVLSLVYISSMLEEYSFHVTTAERASVALTKIREQKNKFRLVIANISMDNFSNLHEIKGELPVVVMSSDRRIARKAIAEGASYFLEKPVALKDLSPVWQHADWKRKDQNNGSRQENVLEKGNNQSESQGIIKINETATLSRPLMEGNIIKEASGTFRPPSRGITIKEPPVNSVWPRDALKTLESGGFPIPNTGCEYHGNLRTNPLCITMQKKPSLTLIIDDEDNILQNTKKQEGCRLNRQLGEREGNTQEKKMKTGLDITNFGSFTVNEKGKEKDGAKEKPRSIWNQELHHNFTEAIRALGEDYASPRMIQEKMNVPGVTIRQIGNYLQKHKAERQGNNQTGITRLPPINLPTFTHSLTAFAPPLERHNPLMLQHGQGNMNFGAMGTSHPSIPKLPVQPDLNTYRADLSQINEAGTKNLPSISQSSCKHAITAFSSPIERPNPLLSQHGQENLDFGVVGTSQSIPPKSPTQPEVNEHRAEVQQNNETGATSLPFRSQSSCPSANALFSTALETQSSVLSPHEHGSFDFGSVGNVQGTITKPQTQPEANVGSFLSYGQRTSDLCSGQIRSCGNSDLYHKHIPDDMQIETHGMLGKFDQRKTYRYSMNQQGKGKQPLEEEGSGILPSIMNLPNEFFEPPTLPSPYISAEEGSCILPSIMNLPNVFFEPPTTPSPYVSAVTQAPELNLPNSSYAPPTAASPYVSASTQVSEMNFENLSDAPPTVPSPHVAASNQVSKVSLANSSYVPPRMPSPHVASGTQVSKTNLHNSSYAPPMAPSPYMAVGTQVSEVNSPKSYAPPSEPITYAISGTRVSEMNLSQSSHAPPRAASPYLSTSTQVSELNVENLSHVHPRVPSPYVVDGNQVFEVSLAHSSYAPPMEPSSFIAVGTQVYETNINNLSYAPSPYMAVGTQVFEVNLPNGYVHPSEPTLSVAAGTREPERNLPQLTYAIPSAPPPYVAASTRVSEMNLATPNYVSHGAASPYMSASTSVLQISTPSSADTFLKVPSPYVPSGMFQLPNSPIHLYKNQEFLPNLATGVLNSAITEAVNSAATEAVNFATTEVVDSATTEVANYSPASNIINGSQNLDPIMNRASATDSPSQSQSFSEYAEILRILDDDTARFHHFEYGPNLNDHYFEWLQKNMDEKNTDPH